MVGVSGEVAARPGEIDEARWVTMAEATAVLTYGRDRALLHLLPASKSQ